MDNKTFVKAIMNPTRQRIIQYLIINKKATPNEIKTALPDIPQASLYRHISTLLSSNCIEVVSEKSVRGTVEKTYGLVQNPLKAPQTKEDINSIIFYSLLELQGSFGKYFESDISMEDMQKDLLFLQTSTIMLSDSEFTEMLTKIGKVISESISNEPNQERKPRRFTIISSPNNGQQ